jgi:hypothetical protein
MRATTAHAAPVDDRAAEAATPQWIALLRRAAFIITDAILGTRWEWKESQNSAARLKRETTVK